MMTYYNQVTRGWDGIPPEKDITENTKDFNGIASERPEDQDLIEEAIAPNSTARHSLSVQNSAEKATDPSHSSKPWVSVQTLTENASDPSHTPQHSSSHQNPTAKAADPNNAPSASSSIDDFHSSLETARPSHEPNGNRGDGPPNLEQTTSRAEKMSGLQITIIMMSLCMALFLAALDITIITTALPTIAQHFSASASNYAWVGSAYILANAASVPVWGKVSDIWGRKPVILLANAIFLVGSLICGLATSIGMLIGGRVIQGIGGGGLVILVNICISDLFSMRDRAKYFGITGMVWAIASTLGPILGGIFTEKVTWRWCFYINLPLDGLAFVLLVFFLKLETPRTPFIKGIKSVDWIGVITVVGGIVMFLIGLESGGLTHPWASAYTLCLIIFGILTIAIFLVNEWRFAKYPIMPLRLFSNTSNIAAFSVCFCHGFVFISGTYFLPLYFQTVLSASPILSGVYLFPLAISLSLASAATGVFIKKTGRYREPIWFGVFLMTLGFGLFIDLPPYASWPRLIIFQIIAGIGVGPNFQSPLIAIQSHIHPSDIATATATFGFVRNIGTSISVVLGGVIFGNELSKHSSGIAAALGPAAAKTLSGSSFGSTTNFVKHLPAAQKVVVNKAYTDSLQKMWIFYTTIGVVGIVASGFVKKRVLNTEHQRAKTGLEEQERVRRERVEERKVKDEEKKVRGVEKKMGRSGEHRGEESANGDANGVVSKEIA